MYSIYSKRIGLSSLSSWRQPAWHRDFICVLRAIAYEMNFDHNSGIALGMLGRRIIFPPEKHGRRILSLVSPASTDGEGNVFG